ncbi:MAG: cyclic nucleotide-binding and patatin-like phospholipase domain-containing protein [Vicinamibacterales bacterium]
MTDDITSALRAVDHVVGGPGLFRSLDAASRAIVEAEMRWTWLNGGDVLFRQGDVGDAMYLVITGKLEALNEATGGEPESLGEISRGEWVGEMAVLTGDPRSATIRAKRDSSLVRFSREAFERTTLANPHAMLAMTRGIVRRLRERDLSSAPPARVATIAVVSVDGSDAHLEVAANLTAALEAIGPTQALTSSLVTRELSAQDRQAASRWFDDRERDHAYSVYICDASPTPWTASCVRQADKVVLVANGDSALACDGTAWARGLPADEQGPPPELILLHTSDRPMPHPTGWWLSATNAAAHHHVRRGVRSDYERVARFLSGQAIGLVLGGGGARGFAHIGVIRALQEAGVPIDAVGGTSMGAVIGAQCALGYDHATMRALNRRHWIDTDPFRDKTLPVVALLTCRRLQRMVTEMFGDIDIRDLWRPFFCVSADLTRAEPHVHDRGLLARAVRASISLPGLAVPIYDNGAVLIDGAVLNNLPADLMKKRCGGPVVAVNVTPREDLVIEKPFPPVLSGWVALFRRKHLSVPHIVDIMMRTTMLGSARQRQQVRASIDLMLNPAIETFGMFDWHRLDDIADAGYACARTAIEQWDRKPASIERQPSA